MQNCTTWLFAVLVYNADLSAQLKEHLLQRCSSLNFDSSESVVAGYLSILSRHELDSWAKKLSATSTHALGYGVARLLLTEIETHSPSISTAYSDPLITDALRMTMRDGGVKAATRINRIYVSNRSDLYSMFIKMFHLGSDTTEIIASLLCTPTSNSQEREGEIDFQCPALKHFLPSLLWHLSRSPFSTCKLNNWCASVCLHYILDDEIIDIESLRTILDHTDKEISYPPQRWDRPILDTPLARFIRPCHEQIVGGSTWLSDQEKRSFQELLARLIRIHPWDRDRYRVSDFYAQGIPCLERACRMDMVEVTQALIPHYKEHYSTRSWEAEHGLPILRTAITFSARSFAMLVQEISWPTRIVQILFDYWAPVYQADQLAIIRETVERLADLHSLPRPKWHLWHSAPDGSNTFRLSLGIHRGHICQDEDTDL
jgi:hypothetical protein